jgi:hypothetical protein
MEVTQSHAYFKSIMSWSSSSRWQVANIISQNYDTNDATIRGLLSRILPGSFVVLQGSPGDGMSNTLDTLPVPARDDPGACTGASLSNGSKTRSFNRMVSLEEIAVEECQEEAASGEMKMAGSFC